MSTTITGGTALTTAQTTEVLRTVTFKSVLWGAARLAGIDPQSRDLSTARAQQLAEFINERVREAMEYSRWPQVRWVEQRWYHDGVHVSGSTYASGRIVYIVADEAYYESNKGTSETPSSTATDWDVTTSYSKLIPWEQVYKTKIGVVEHVYYSDPRENNTPTPLVYKTVDREGIYVTDSSAADSVWVSLAIREPEFTATEHDTSKDDWAVDDVTYWPATGECYRSLASGNQTSNPSTDANWDKVDFPYIWASFVKRAAFADYLTSQRQTDESAKQLRMAYRRLDDSLYQQGRGQQIPAPVVNVRVPAVR